MIKKALAKEVLEGNLYVNAKLVSNTTASFAQL